MLRSNTPSHRHLEVYTSSRPAAFTYAIVAEGPERYCLLKIFDTNGAHVELAHFESRRDAMAFAATLPRPRRVMVL
jgi:hypothetical protein